MAIYVHHHISLAALGITPEGEDTCILKLTQEILDDQYVDTYQAYIRE